MYQGLDKSLGLVDGLDGVVYNKLHNQITVLFICKAFVNINIDIFVDYIINIFIVFFNVDFILCVFIMNILYLLFDIRIQCSHNLLFLYFISCYFSSKQIKNS